MLPPQAKEDDLLVILLGAKIPYLLRRVDSRLSARRGYTCTLVGGAYVYGFMNRQAATRCAKQTMEGRRDGLGRGPEMLTLFHIL